MRCGVMGLAARGQGMWGGEIERGVSYVPVPDSPARPVRPARPALVLARPLVNGLAEQA